MNQKQVYTSELRPGDIVVDSIRHKVRSPDWFIIGVFPDISATIPLYHIVYNVFGTTKVIKTSAFATTKWSVSA